MSPPLPSEAEQKFVLISVMLSMFLYGVEFVIFIQCIRALQSESNTGRNFPRRILLTYITVMFLLGTWYVLVNTAFSVLAYTTHRDFPGGPAQWDYKDYSSWSSYSVSMCGTVSSWGADGLLLYRCFVIYSSSFLKPLRPVLLLPILFFIGEVIAGLLALVQFSHNPVTIWNTINLGLPVFTITTGCNVTITLCIVTPLLVHRRRLLRTFGRNREYTEPYTSVVAILVESSAMFAVVATILIGFYARNHPASHLFLEVLSQVQVIAPLLIILRVAHRKSWTSTTEEELTAISFTHSTHSSHHKSILPTGGTSTTIQQGGHAEFIQFEGHTTTTVKDERSPSPAELIISGLDTPSEKANNEGYIISGGRITPLHDHMRAV